MRNFSLLVAKAGSAVCGGKLVLRFPVTSPAPPLYRGRMSSTLLTTSRQNGAVVRAYSGARDLAAIVRAMRIAWRELSIDPWVEYVRSAANLADWPSRGKVAEILAMRAARVTFKVPIL